MKKLLNKKGFTLMEMMIVVAIIVILVAISIPTFSGSMDKANAATDAANLRAAKAVLINAQMANETVTGYYDNESASFVEKSKADTGKCSKHKEAYIGIVNNEVKWVTVNAEGEATPVADQACAGAN